MIDLIYETAFDSTLWPAVLIRLADISGTVHVGLASMDSRAQTYESIAPRTDPAMHASYKQYWAFQNPVWALSATRPAGEVYLLDSLIPRKDFAATPVFNEWFRPAKFGLAMMSANLHIGDKVSALIAVANAPKNDEITGGQMRVFKAALPHIDRAVRMHREFRIRDLDHDAAPARLETLPRSVMVVEGAARVLFTNTAARTLLGSDGGLTVKGGCLLSTDGLNVVEGCVQSPRAERSRREMAIERGPLRPGRPCV